MNSSPASRSAVLAIDCGGTKISGAIVDSDFRILAHETVPSRDTVAGIADPQLFKTKALISSLIARADDLGITLIGAAAGFPEYVNLRGLLTTRENIDWPEQPKDDFARLTLSPWVIESDVRCAGVAEARFGSGKEFSDFVYITISSGISHTHFLNGKAVTGQDGEAIGFGVKKIDIAGTSIPLENYSSGLGIARRFGQISGEYAHNAQEIFNHDQSDASAREIIDTAADLLGTEIAKFAKSLPTKLIVIGGGLWLGSQKYRDLVTAAYVDASASMGFTSQIVNAQVEHSGVIGAAIYAFG